ncbi:hypothetical protein TTRE_0000516001 [Trichuris trichiura]|uniref:RanBP2-type domain-containing protein n=1 Tax=Trichuris trichiura TaxID=36087 RepID=A0A077Z8T0_TRITR|nr:hypothetical protein TTRE_0000516001 [Trichuris trichiura]
MIWYLADSSFCREAIGGHVIALMLLTNADFNAPFYVRTRGGQDAELKLHLFLYASLDVIDSYLQSASGKGSEHGEQYLGPLFNIQFILVFSHLSGTTNDAEVRSDSSWLQSLRSGVGMSAFSGLRSFFEAITAPFSPAKQDSSCSSSEQSTSESPARARFPENAFHFSSSQLNSSTPSFSRDQANYSSVFSLPPHSARNHIRENVSKSYNHRRSLGIASSRVSPPHRISTPNSRSPYDVPKLQNNANFSRRIGEKFKLFNHQEATPILKISKTAQDFAQPIRRRQNINSVSLPLSDRRNVASVSTPIPERNETLPLQRRHPSCKKPVERSLEMSTPSTVSSKSQSFAGNMSDPFNFKVPWAVDFSSVETNERKKKKLSDDISSPYIALDECLLCRTPKVVPSKSPEEESLESFNQLPVEQKRWQCGVCLLTNSPDTLRCIGCATLRGVYDLTARNSELNSTLLDQAESSMETSVPNKKSAFATSPLHSGDSGAAPELADERLKSGADLHNASVLDEEDLSEELSAAADSGDGNDSDADFEEEEEEEGEEEDEEEEEEEDDDVEEESENFSRNASDEDEEEDEEADMFGQKLNEGEPVKRLINCLFEYVLFFQEIIDLCSDSDGDHNNAADEVSQEASETLNFSNYPEKSQVCSKAGDSNAPIVSRPEDEEPKRSEVRSSNGAAVVEKRPDINAVLVQPSLQALVAGPSTWIFPPSQQSAKESQNLASSPESSKEDGVASTTPSTAGKTPTSEGPSSCVSREASSQPAEDTTRVLNIDASGNGALSIVEQTEAEKADEALRGDLSQSDSMVEAPSEPSSIGGTELANMPTVEEPQKASEPFQFVQPSGSRPFTFGQPLPTSSPLGFGQPPAASSLFGASTTTTSSVSPFSFGLATSSSFGNQPTEPSGATKALFSNFGQQPMNTTEDNTSKRDTVGGKGFCFGQSSSAQPFSSNTAAATSTTSIFGTPASTSSLFGTATTTTSIFGAAAPSASVFGSATPTTSATSLFSTATPTASIFGSPATTMSPFSTPTSTTSIFGGSLASQTQNESLFSQNALKQNVFNFGQKPSFGTTPFQSAKQGDQPATTAASGFNFGNATAFAAAPSSAGSSSSLFASWGGQPIATSTAPSIFKFGQTAAPPSFQQQPTSNAPTVFSFGGAKPANVDATQQQSSIFGSAVQPSTTTSAFSWMSQMASSSSTPSFGSPSVFTFGRNPAKSGDYFTAGQTSTGEAKDSSSANPTTAGAGSTDGGSLPSAPTVFNAAGLTQAQSGTAASGRRMIHARRRVRRC